MENFFKMGVKMKNFFKMGVKMENFCQQVLLHDKSKIINKNSRRSSVKGSLSCFPPIPTYHNWSSSHHLMSSQPSIGGPRARRKSFLIPHFPRSARPFMLDENIPKLFCPFLFPGKKGRYVLPQNRLSMYSLCIICP